LTGPSYSIVSSADQLKALFARLVQDGRPVGFDVETYGPAIVWRGKRKPNPYKARLLGFSVSLGDEAWYVPVAHMAIGSVNTPRLAALAFCDSLFEYALLPNFRLVMFNAGYELQVLRNEGLALFPFSDHLDDASLSGWLAGWGKKLKLKSLANERYGYDLPDFKKVFGDRDARETTPEEMAEYAVKDPWLTVRLHNDAMVELEKHDLYNHYRTMEMPLVEVVRGMQERGALVERGPLVELRAKLVAEMAELKTRFRELTQTFVEIPAKERQPTGELFKNGNPKLKTVDVKIVCFVGADIGNDHQVSRWMYEELKLWPTTGLTRNGVGNFPVDKILLERFTLLPDLAGELTRMRLRYQAASKLVSTYIDVMLELPEQYGDGALHTSYSINGTNTQRFSSSGPNLQNIPVRTEEGKKLRDALVARPGFEIVIYDYSQIELRLCAHLSRDPEMEMAYVFDEDIHAKTLAVLKKHWIGAQRTDAKITNFSTFYRISALNLAIKQRSTVENAEKSIEAFYESYPLVKEYHARSIAFATKNGYAPSLDGYKAFLEPPRNNKWGRFEMSWGEQNKAVNYPVQSSAAGMIKLAMIAIHREWVRKGAQGTKAFLIEQTHDEIGAELAHDFVAEGSADMRRLMESVVQLRVPVVANGGAGSSWSNAK